MEQPRKMSIQFKKKNVYPIMKIIVNYENLMLVNYE